MSIKKTFEIIFKIIYIASKNSSDKLLAIRIILAMLIGNILAPIVFIVFVIFNLPVNFITISIPVISTYFLPLLFMKKYLSNSYYNKLSFNINIEDYNYLFYQFWLMLLVLFSIVVFFTGMIFMLFLKN